MGLQQTYLLRGPGCVSPVQCFVFLWVLLLSLFLSSTPCAHHHGDLRQQQLQHVPRSSRHAAATFYTAFEGFSVLPSHALSAGRAHGAGRENILAARVNNNSGESSISSTSSSSSSRSRFSEGRGLFPSSLTSTMHLRPPAQAATAGRFPLLPTASRATTDKVLQRSSSPNPALAFVGGRPSALLRTSNSKATGFSSQQQRQRAATSAADINAAAAAETRASASLSLGKQLQHNQPRMPSCQSLLRSSSNSKTSEYSLEGDPIDGPLQPLRGMVLLQRKDVQETSPGGVYLPSESKDRQVLAKVLAVGPGELRQGDSTQRIPLDVQPGDWAVISRHAYDTVKYNGKECVIVAAADILAKVKDVSQDADPVPADLLPLGEAVLVKVYKQPEKTASGLYVHPGGDAQSRTLKRGVVVAVGPGRYNKDGKRVALEIKVGKNVLYPQYAQDEPDMKYGTDFFAFVKAADILAEW